MRGIFHLTTTMHSRSCRWHRVLSLVLDSSLFNAFIQYREDATTAGLAIYSRQLWYYTLAAKLILPFIRVNVFHAPVRNLSQRGFHHTERHVALHRRCVICSHRTRQFCAGCGGRFMCTDVCYVCMHTQPKFCCLGSCGMKPRPERQA